MPGDRLLERWSQDGFLARVAGEKPDGTPRDLLGFKHGTGNPRRASELDRHVWIGSGDRSWMSGGSYLVVRRIQILLDLWQRLPTRAQERVIGRHHRGAARRHPRIRAPSAGRRW